MKSISTISRVSLTVGLLSMLVISGLLFAPRPAVAAPLIPCSGVDETVTGGSNAPEGRPCTFNDIIKLISNVIDFLLFTLAPIIAAGVFVYAGILMLFSGGNPESRNKAKGLIGKVVIGLIIAFGAWILVKTIFVSLGYNDGIFPKFY